MRLVTPTQMREIEAQTARSGVSYGEMMEQAGLGLSEHILKFASERGFRDVLFLCGSGNNAGDCFVAAKALRTRLNVKIALLCGEPRTELAVEKHWELVEIPVLSEKDAILSAIAESTLIVDGVFGIGFHGALPDDVRNVFQAAQGKPCIAVDLPSGGNGETGETDPDTLRCAMTVTFGAGKLGTQLPPLSERCGKTVLVEIGTPQAVLDGYPLEALTHEEIIRTLPNRPFSSHKGMFGRLLLVCGSKNMPGAAIMAVGSALRSGVGTLVLASVEKTCDKVSAHYPEAMLLPLPMASDGSVSEAAVPNILQAAKQATAVLIGCGLGNTVHTKKLVEQLLSSLDCPIILDADGLNVLAADIDMLHRSSAPIILTPHPAEMGRLLGLTTAEIQKERVAAASNLPLRFPNVTVVLKGSGTLVASGTKRTLNPTGNSGMSKGGSGDVLAGIIGALTAEGLTPYDAARIGAFLHGFAGDLAAAEYSKAAMLPTDIIAMLPQVFLNLEKE